MAKRQQGQRSQGRQSEQSREQPLTSAIELLKQDHRNVEKLFEEFDETDDRGEQRQLAQLMPGAK